MRDFSLEHLCDAGHVALHAVTFDGVVPALAILASHPEGKRLELWINTRCARFFEDYCVDDLNLLIARFSETWEPRRFKGRSRRLGGRGWSDDLARFVEAELGEVTCMAGELSGVNLRAYRNTLESCRRLGLEGRLAYAVAAGSTPFWRSRYNLGYSYTEIASGYLPAEIVLLMYKPGTPARVRREISRLQKRNVGNGRDPAWSPLPSPVSRS